MIKKKKFDDNHAPQAIFMKKNMPQAMTYSAKRAAGRIFGPSPDG